MVGDRVSPRVQTKPVKTLPKTLPGAVCVQWKRCGKTTCRCARGELHGPYYYHFWREGGRLRKAYVKASDVAAVQAACARRQQVERQQRHHRDTGRQIWRDLVAYLKEVDRDG